MKLATRASGGPDGRLLVVSRDLLRAEEAVAAQTLQSALDRWDEVGPALTAQSKALHDDIGRGSPVEVTALAGALPRAWQFLDASAFLAHNHILADAWGYEKRTEADPPLMYQGLSDQFHPPHGAVFFRSEDDGIDFEAEFAVILDHTPLGTRPEAALAHVKLIVLLNDWSLRGFGPSEMKAGFGFLHAKPASTLSAIAVTPDELGAAWSGGRLRLPLEVRRGEEIFGRPHGGAMSYGFDALIAHACLTRDLCAGTVLGSGTVSNFDAAKVGSGCISERKGLDALEPGRPSTPYLAFGERVRLEVRDEAGGSIFGSIDQIVMQLQASG